MVAVGVMIRFFAFIFFNDKLAKSDFVAPLQYFITKNEMVGLLETVKIEGIFGQISVDNNNISNT